MHRHEAERKSFRDLRIKSRWFTTVLIEWIFYSIESNSGDFIDDLLARVDLCTSPGIVAPDLIATGRPTDNVQFYYSRN